MHLDFCGKNMLAGGGTLQARETALALLLPPLLPPWSLLSYQGGGPSRRVCFGSRWAGRLRERQKKMQGRF